MKITVLSENTSEKSDISAEHGLSLYIETDHETILFDMGQGPLFAQNAKLLECDISRVNFAVLSHGHYDHGGGIASFIEENDRAPIYVSRHAFGKFYHGSERYIGLDEGLRSRRRLRLIPDKLILNDRISIHSCNYLQRPYSTYDDTLTEKANGTFMPDSFLHEQYLLIKENGKRILFSGCSHKGVLNILSWFKPDVFIGGFHLTAVSEEEKLRDIAKKLSAYKKTSFYTCHCTGCTQYDALKKRLPHLQYLSCGTSVTL